MNLSPRMRIALACLGIVGTIAIAVLLLLRPLPKGDLDAARAALAAGQRSKALEQLNAWIAQHADMTPGEPRMPGALLMRGDLLVDIGDAYSALYDYERIAEDHRQSPEFAEAVVRELALAIKLVKGEIVGGRFGRAKAAGEIGEELLVRVAERLPDSTHAETALWELGLFYERSNNPQLASAAYDIFVQRFPSSARRPEAEKRIKELEQGSSSP